jgi:hypothetical protein
MFLLSDLGRLTLRLDQGFGAYLRFFSEASTCEQRDLTRLGALLSRADGPWRSTSLSAAPKERGLRWVSPRLIPMLPDS